MGAFLVLVVASLVILLFGVLIATMGGRGVARSERNDDSRRFRDKR